MPATFVEDSFTDTAGTDLTAHTGETGATWAEHPDWTGGNAVVSDAGRVRNDVSSTLLCYASGVSTGADQDVSADVVRQNSLAGPTVGVLGRVSTTASDAYMAIRQTSSYTLNRMLSGSFATLGTYSHTPTIGVSYATKLEIRDATKKVYIDGVERISSTDNAITTGDNTGLWFTGAQENDSGVHLDNFLAIDPDAGGTAATGTATVGNADAAGGTIAASAGVAATHTVGDATAAGGTHTGSAAIAATGIASTGNTQAAGGSHIASAGVAATATAGAATVAGGAHGATASTAALATVGAVAAAGGSHAAAASIAASALMGRVTARGGTHTATAAAPGDLAATLAVDHALLAALHTSHALAASLAIGHALIARLEVA